MTWLAVVDGDIRGFGSGGHKEGQWTSGRGDVSELGRPGFDSSSRQSQVVAHKH